MMRIKTIASQPDMAGRHTVRFEDDSILRLYRQTLEDFSLYAGQELSEEEMTALKEAAGAMSAKMRAVRIVSASSVSKKDLEHRLIQKGEDPKQARDAVAWMAELDLVDDQKTAEQVVARCIGKGYGLARAKQALYEKRIPKQYWDAALADYPDQSERIAEFLQSRLTDLQDAAQRRKAIDALIRKGHSYQTIRRVLAQLSVDTEDFPEEM